jgi:hypothetical protein
MTRWFEVTFLAAPLVVLGCGSNTNGAGLATKIWRRTRAPPVTLRQAAATQAAKRALLRPPVGEVAAIRDGSLRRCRLFAWWFDESDGRLRLFQ